MAGETPEPVWKWW